MIKIKKVEKISTGLLDVLAPRTRMVIERRFGIGPAGKRATLEAIGKTMNITRERVRQIEAVGLKRIRESGAFTEALPVIGMLAKEIDQHGVVAEAAFLGGFQPAERNHVHFLLSLHPDTKRLKEDDEFAHRWTVDQKKADEVEQSLRALHDDLLRNEEEPLTLNELTARLVHCAQEHYRDVCHPAVAQSWLALSRRIAKSPLNEWGLASSPHVNPRGVRDLSYLVMKRHGSPLHFTEVTEMIRTKLNRPAHVQTVHNELIKDTRFILVGRGLYALKEWGYQEGTVRDVIKSILANVGKPIAKSELIKRILQERHVKESTVLINLQNREYFKRLDNGTYTLA